MTDGEKPSMYDYAQVQQNASEDDFFNPNSEYNQMRNELATPEPTKAEEQQAKPTEVAPTEEK